MVELRGRHQGETIIVLGGAPSLPFDLSALTSEAFDGAVLIGVNQHAAILPLDYVYFRDPEVWPAIEALRCAKVAPHCTFEQYGVIHAGHIPDFGFSGPEALWIADYMEASMIVLCGFGLFAPGRRYWHSLAANDAGHNFESGIKSWQRARDYCKRPDRVRSVSGPLVEIFGGLDAKG